MLASTLHCVVLVTGKTDIITNGETTELCEKRHTTPVARHRHGLHGTRVVRFIQRRDGSVYGCGFSRFHHGHCGELAERKSEGLGSFRIALLDALSLLSDDDYTRLLQLREV